MESSNSSKGPPIQTLGGSACALPIPQEPPPSELLFCNLRQEVPSSISKPIRQAVFHQQTALLRNTTKPTPPSPPRLPPGLHSLTRPLEPSMIPPAPINQDIHPPPIDPPTNQPTSPPKIGKPTENPIGEHTPPALLTPYPLRLAALPTHEWDKCSIIPSHVDSAIGIIAWNFH